MGGDDSQKLLPWRGIHSSPGPKPPAHYEFNTVAENCAGRELAATSPGQSTCGSWLSYRLPGSILASRPGSLLPRAEGACGRLKRQVRIDGDEDDEILMELFF